MTSTAPQLLLVRVLLAILWSALCNAAFLRPKSTCTYVGPVPCTPSSLPLRNGNFASGKLAPWSANGSDGETLTNFTVVRLPVSQPEYALRIDTYIHHVNYPQSFVQQKALSICPTFEYRVSFDYKVLKAREASSLYALPDDGDNPFDGDEQFPGAEVSTNETTSDWKHIATLNKVFAVSQVDFHVGMFTPGPGLGPNGGDGPAVLITNVAMELVKTLIPAECPLEPAPLVNNHFQSGAISPWQVYGQQNFITHAVVPTSNSSYALRFKYNPNVTDAEPAVQYPVVGPICIGYVYFFEFFFNVVKPMPPTGADGYQYQLVVGHCSGVSPTNSSEFAEMYGPLPFDTPGKGSIVGMCRMNRNKAEVIPRLTFSTYNGGAAVVDILSVTARLATTDDFS